MMRRSSGCSRPATRRDFPPSRSRLRWASCRGFALSIIGLRNRNRQLGGYSTIWLTPPRAGGSSHWRSEVAAAISRGRALRTVWRFGRAPRSRPPFFAQEGRGPFDVEQNPIRLERIRSIASKSSGVGRRSARAALVPVRPTTTRKLVAARVPALSFRSALHQAAARLGASIAVFKEGSVLLVKRGRGPLQGLWSCLVASSNRGKGRKPLCYAS
jgi:hypothetical protein